jgi:uracil-DNA glycosylase family 4
MPRLDSSTPRLLDSFDSHACLLADLPTTHSALCTRHSALVAVQAEIAGCRDCVERGYIPEARPVFRGHAGMRLMVVGQAPGTASHGAGLPYSGATGKTLAAWLERAGLQPGALYELFYLTSLTKCFPGPARNGGQGDRPPSAKEIAFCREHLDREIALVQPEIVLALGRMSAERLDPTVRGQALADVVGTLRPAERAGHAFLVLPLPHPSGVSRWLNQPAHRVRLDLALALLRDWHERT